MAFEKDKSTVLLMAIVLIVALGSIIFIQYNRRSLKTGIEQNNNPNTNTEKNGKIEVESLLKSFVESYNSYTTGDFSNIESLYYMMDKNLIEEESQKIEILKKELGQNKSPYQTVQSNITEYKELQHKEKNIVAQISIEKLVSDGAYIPDPKSEDGLLIFVDRDGNATEEKSYNYNTKKTSEAFQITATEENGEWKISQIQKISE